jgi:rhodanese-related sulfurtransferase
MRTIDAATLNKWLEDGDAVLIDVREPGEHKAERIAGAQLLPLGQVDLARLPGRDGKVVIHCQKGGRGEAACRKLLAQAPAMEIYNLEGGLNAWRDRGLPVQKSGKAFLPLDRQVQVTVGILILAASALTYFVSSAFLLLAALFGLGLLSAGLTGFCGLGRLLAVMPWNSRPA